MSAISRSELRRGTAAIRAGFEEFFSSVRRDDARLELRFRILQRTMAPGLAGREEADGQWRIAIDSYTDATRAEYDQPPSHEP